MRRAVLKTAIVAGALALPRPARADCDGAPCADAEPMWLAPASGRFALISDTRAPAFGSGVAAIHFGFRWRPAVISVPSPNQQGRDVNALRHATDVTLGLRGGIGRKLELTLVVPAGLYQRGAGIKGITHQSAPAVSEQSLHDVRLGFGSALPVASRSFGAKLRLELKLPLGNTEALSGEKSLVASPTVALSAGKGGWFAGLELGARWRRPSELYGSRVGSQGLLALGAGYELTRPKLTFVAEAYVLPSIIRSATTSYVPAEWLISARFAPRALPRWSFGLSGGTGLPFSSNSTSSFLAFGVPMFRGSIFARVTSPDG